MVYFVVNEPGAWAHPGNVKNMVVEAGNIRDLRSSS